MGGRGAGGEVALYKLPARLPLRLSTVWLLGGEGCCEQHLGGGAGDTDACSKMRVRLPIWVSPWLGPAPEGLPGPAELRTPFLEPRLAPPHPQSPSAEMGATARGPR